MENEKDLKFQIECIANMIGCLVEYKRLERLEAKLKELTSGSFIYPDLIEEIESEIKLHKEKLDILFEDEKDCEENDW